MPKEQERTQQKAKKANRTKQNTKQTKPQPKRQTARLLKIMAFCIIKWIGMARKQMTKRSETPITKSPYKRCEKKEHSTVRKPGLPPARSPEITQSKHKFPQV